MMMFGWFLSNRLNESRVYILRIGYQKREQLGVRLANNLVNDIDALSAHKILIIPTIEVESEA